MESKLKGPILIVGASGFIGTNLYNHLMKTRSDVYGLSRRSKLSVDITNFEHLKYVLHEIKPRTIFNLATYGGTSLQTDSPQIYNINYMGTNNLLRIMKEIGYDAFVQAGSQSEYGYNCEGPLEEDFLSPNSDYAVAKIGVSYLIKYYGNNFPCVHLRLYSIYGPLEDEIRLIPKMVVYGMNGCYPPLADKDITHDFVYIDDCLEALIKAAVNIDNARGEAINIATGVATSLEDVALTSQRIFNIQERPVFGDMPNRKWDLPNWYGNARKAEHLIGWKYHTTLEEGMRRMI
jgi:nucleoside-diphosphate-sugar epimerase